MNMRVSYAAAFAVQQNFDLARHGIQYIQLAIVRFAVAGVSLVIFIVAEVPNVGIPVRVIVDEPCCKYYLLNAKFGQTSQALLVMKELLRCGTSITGIVPPPTECDKSGCVYDLLP